MTKHGGGDENNFLNSRYDTLNFVEKLKIMVVSCREMFNLGGALRTRSAPPHYNTLKNSQSWSKNATYYKPRATALSN